MGDPINWYALPRTVDDPESIMEAIDEKLLSHNMDPSAHGQSDEAVYEHRNSPQLDHPEGSVGSVKFSNREFYYYSTFESLDAWENFGQSANLGWPGVFMQTTNSSGQFCIITSIPYETSGFLNFEKNPIFQFISKLSSLSNVEFDMLWGSIAGDETDQSFGFDVRSGALNAVVVQDGVWTEEEITGVDVTEYHIYRARWDSTNKKCYFYIDGVEEKTITVTSLPSVSESGPWFKVKTLEDVNKHLSVRDSFITRDQ